MTEEVALSLVRTPAERAICEKWAAERRVPLVWSAAEAVAVAEPGQSILPVRVLWHTDRSRRDHFVESLGGWALERRQRKLMAHGDGQLLTGEPALVSELALRWSERSGSNIAEGAEFEAFVERQAAITLDRAERQATGDRYRAPRAVVDEVMTSPGFLPAAEKLARQLGRSPEVVLTDIRAYLDEMASEQHRFAVDIWARWAKWLYSRGFKLDVDPDDMQRIRALGANHPLVFLPSHRSNLDPYVMASLLYENSMPQNHTLGGINMAFWPIGPLGRRVGVVFIRRSFRENDVYRFVLQRYLAFLVAKRFNLEWYVEGTRSRTGKLMPPRLGLVNWLIDAVDSHERDDVFAVPTSIVYDLLPEATEMTAESRGSHKTGEGLLWLARYARRQRGQLGSVHVRFGEPLNIRETLHSFGSSTDDATSAGRLARSKIAFEVCVRINRATMLTAPALLLFALLGVEDRALTFDEVRDVVRPVLAYAGDRDIPLDDAAVELSTDNGLATTLEFLTDHGIVSRYLGREAVYRISADEELLAAFYRNSIVHWFVNRAIIELVLIDAPASLAEGWEQSLRLRDLLKFEFFFPEKSEFAEELSREMSHLDPEWRSRRDASPGEIARVLVDSGMLVAHRTLRSFLEAYLVVAEQLAALGDSAAERDSIIAACLRLGRQYHLQQKVRSPEAVSSHLFGTAVKLAANRGLLAAGAGLARREFADEMSEVMRRLERISELSWEHAS